MTTDIDLQDLLDIEWEGCGCSNPEEGACPVCGGKPWKGGHANHCWLAEAIAELANEG